MMKKKLHDTHELKPLIVEIEDRPVNPLGRSILWVIILAMLFGSAWLYLAKIDVVVTARGKFIPTGEVKILQPVDTGVVSKINVKEGDFVKKGDVLVQIDPQVTQTNLASKQKALELLHLEIQKLKALIKKSDLVYRNQTELSLLQKEMFHAKKALLVESLEKIEKQVSQVKEEIAQVESEKRTTQTLLESEQTKEKRLFKVLDLIAKEEYITTQNKITEYESKIKQLSHKLQGLKERILESEKEKKVVVHDYRVKLLEELTQKEKEANGLMAKIDTISFQNRKQQLIAPEDGYIAKLSVHTVGGVVTPAEKLISLVPKKALLVIKAIVENKDIGYVKEKMKSAVKIDTFDFQKYGLIDGEVIHISNDAIEDEKLGPVYEVLIESKQNFLTVEHKKEYFNSGLSVTAELKVGKRRVIEFFIYPIIKYLDEGMSVR